MTIQENIRLLGLSDFCTTFLNCSFDTPEAITTAGATLAHDFLEYGLLLSCKQRQLFFAYIEEVYVSQTNEALLLLDDNGFFPTLVRSLSLHSSEHWHPDVFVRFLGKQTRLRLIFWFEVLHETTPEVLCKEPTQRLLEEKYQLLECFIEHHLPDFSAYLEQEGSADSVLHGYRYTHTLYTSYIPVLSKFFIKNFRQQTPETNDKMFRFIDFFDENFQMKTRYNESYDDIRTGFAVDFLENIYIEAEHEKNHMTRTEIYPYLGPFSKEYIKVYFRSHRWDEINAD